MTQAAQLEAFNKLNKDIKTASITLSEQEARFLVDSYYQMQGYRISTNNQCRKLTTTPDGEPHETLSFFAGNYEILEKNLKSVLESYAKSKLIGRWMLSIVGIGPVIAAGLIAHIDIKKVQTAGQIQAFAGLDPTKDWLGKEKATKIVTDLWKKYGFTSPNIGTLVQTHNEDTDEMCEYLDFSKQELLFFAELSEKTGRKVEKLQAFMMTVDENGKKTKSHKASLIAKLAMPPYNADLKTLAWKIGQSFVKVSNNENDYYGKIYKARKVLETAKNENGDYAEQAVKKLENYNIGKDTDAYKWYSKGMLPPAHIQQRCERYATKFFLSHLFTVWYEIEYGCKPPKPFAISQLGHAHEELPPNWPMKED